MSKVCPHAQAALAGLRHDGMTIAAGGFGLGGIPENLIGALRENRRAPRNRTQVAAIMRLTAPPTPFIIVPLPPARLNV